MLGVVIQINGFDPVLGQAVTLRAASHDDPAVCHLGGGEPWWPALTKLPTLRYDLFDGAFSAEITAPSSTLTIAAEPWPNFGRYALADARLQLWTGDVGAAWGAWTLRFDGRVSEQPELADGTASINFAVDDRWLDTALLATYAGTSGPEGTEALKGQPKPLALGAPRYAAGTLVDSINNVFQVSAYGQIQGFEAGLERLARFGAPAGDFVSYAALVAANVPAGRWATAKAVGMARLGAPPTGQISFLIGGDAAGPNGWARLPGAIIRRLAMLSGGAGRINDAALNALDAARPYNLSVYIEQQTTARQLIQQVAASVNAVAAMSWTGQLFVVPVGIGAPALTLAADGTALPPVASVKQVSIASPFQKLAIGATRAWTVHALSDIAFTATLVDLGTYADGTTYREGNIVSLADGSRWLYVSATPSAGRPPSVGDPEHWSSLNPALTASDITYADGTPLEALKPAEPNATVGAPEGTYVFGRKAEDVIDDLDINLAGNLAQGLRQDQLVLITDARDYHQGQLVKDIFLTFREAQITANGITNTAVEVLAAQTEEATGSVLELRQVVIDEGVATARRIDDVEAKNDLVTSDVSQLMEAVVNPDGTGYAKFVLRAGVDGTIVGVSGTSDGKAGRLSFAADQIDFVDPNSGNAINILSYNNGRWTFNAEVYVTSIDDGVVTTRSLAAGSVTGLITMSFPDQAIGPSEVTLAELTGPSTVVVGDGVDGMALIDVQFTQDGSTTFDTAMRVRAYLDVGGGYVLVRDTVQGIAVEKGQARWILSQSFSIPVMSSGSARFKLTATGSSLGGGPTSGSYARNIQLNIFGGKR